MANRQQRRHPPKVTQLPAAMAPMVTQRLREPEVAADLTVAEAKEVTARNEEIEFVRSQAEHFARLHPLLLSEKGMWIRALCTQKGLSTTDEFSLDLDRGVILRMAVQVPVQVEKIEVPPPTDATDAPFVEEPEADLPN